MFRFALTIFCCSVIQSGFAQELEKQIIIDGITASYYCKTQQFSELDSYLEDKGYVLDHKPGTKKVFRHQDDSKGEILLLIMGYEWVEILHTQDETGAFKTTMDEILKNKPFVRIEDQYELALPDHENPGFKTVLTWEGENKSNLTFSPPEIQNETKSWDLYFEEVFAGRPR
ncbi:hypothetical protein [Fulvivirga lutea]|uniref:Uncharacterized protein n=1 Tax=Fulvivirga lutea TaxID=2810512 RepID=A0A974WJ87_9BACT|nr:hypothetical protein [Fulvivirga lutea]QSE98783.1 hypothetical protein JR347_06810 [Fulvivirga lutea]